VRLICLVNNYLGWKALEYLREQEQIAAVVVHPPSRFTRQVEILESARAAGAQIIPAADLRTPEGLERIAQLNAEMGISVMFGYILKSDFLSLLPNGCLNLHPAYLPYNRGVYPNVWSIVDRTPAGVTLHYIDEGIDTGDIIRQKKVPVLFTDTGETLYHKLETAGLQLLRESWPDIRTGRIERTSQSRDSGTSHRARDTAQIDEIRLAESYRAEDLLDILRARTFPPHRGAFIRRAGRKIYIRVQFEEERDEAIAAARPASPGFQQVAEKIAIAQPTYLPWLGYFDLLDQVDKFVLLDTVQFEKQSWQQRNRIKTPTGLLWLTVPAVFRGRLGQRIVDVEIREAEFWRDHLRAVELNYRRAPFFDKYYPALSQLLRSASSGLRLAELTISIFRWLAEALGITTPIVRGSELPVDGRRTHLLAEICRVSGATTYVSPLGSADYLLSELSILTDRDINVVFQHYEHPTYRQLFPPFQAHASVLDLLFNEGENALAIIRSGRRAPFTPAEAALHLNEKVGS